MQDRPTAAELLDALRDFMRDRAGHARDRWERFQFQVAANSLGIISRELELEDEFAAAEWDGLDRLLGAEDRPLGHRAFINRLRERNDDLASRIQRGDFDGQSESELLPHLWQTVVNKVRIASPGANVPSDLDEPRDARLDREL
jgi:hypothetical protein